MGSLFVPIVLFCRTYKQLLRFLVSFLIKLQLLQIVEMVTIMNLTVWVKNLIIIYVWRDVGYKRTYGSYFILVRLSYVSNNHRSIYLRRVL